MTFNCKFHEKINLPWKDEFCKKKNQFYDFISTSKKANKTRSIVMKKIIQKYQNLMRNKQT